MKLRLRKKKELTVFKQVLPDCLNCGKPLDADDNFCSYCGQKNVEKLSFSNFLGQLISGFFSYDSRFWNTIVPLLFKPGKVSRDFIEGKRKRYVNPFQMYLHVSILFFLILGWTNSSGYISKTKPSDIVTLEKIDSLLNEGTTSLDSVKKKEIDSLLFKNDIDTLGKSLKGNFNFADVFNDSIYNIDKKKDSIESISVFEKSSDFTKFINNNPTITNSEEALKKLGYPISFWNRFYFGISQKINKNTKQIGSGDYTDLVNKAFSYISIGLFIFLPIFALSLKLFYIRKRMNYMEHLVFAFHTQTVFFLLLIISTLISLFSTYSNVWVFLLLFLIYLFLALKKFYQQGSFKTFIKFILLNSVYTSLGIIASLIISILTFAFS